MVGSIPKLLWGAFFALVALIAIALAVNFGILNSERRQEYIVVQATEPLLDAVRNMDDSLDTIVSASRGYALTGETQFLQQYDDAVRQFNKNKTFAAQQAVDPTDASTISAFAKFFDEIHSLTKAQIDLKREGKPFGDEVLEVARRRRGEQDFAGLIIDRHRRDQARDQESQNVLRQSLMLSLIIAGVLVLVGAAFAISRIEASMTKSITRQVRRTEAMIAGMSDGVMLVDGDGRTVFINPAGQKL